jgi:hypothetical protein
VSLERSFGYAEEEVQRGADCGGASSDRSVDVTRQSRTGGLSGSRNFAAELYRLRKEYGGLELDQAKRMKDLERENVRLKRLVADLSLEKQVLKDVASGNL